MTMTALDTNNVQVMELRPDSLEMTFIEYVPYVYILVKGIKFTPHGLTCDLNISYPPSSLVIGNITFLPRNRKDRQGLVYQLIKATSHLPFLPWDQVIDYAASKIVELAELHQDGKRPKLAYLDTIQAEEVKFLWEPYIPLGKLTLLEGDPGVGKSLITLALTAAISLGHGLPPAYGPNALGYILLASAEDGLADTIKPRLTAMQAETSNICALDSLFTMDDSGFELLNSFILEVNPVLVIIDPLVAYLSGDMDINKANQVRYATARLAALAEKHGTAILAVRHLTKGGGSKPIYRGLGSIDFTAAARSVLLAGEDPDDPATRGIVHIKSNLTAQGDPIGYRISREFGFQWLSSSTLTAEQILSSSESGSGALETAKNFLLAALEHGPQVTTAVFADADNQGISKGTLNRAKTELKVISFNQAEPGKRGAGRWYMRLNGAGKDD